MKTTEKLTSEEEKQLVYLLEKLQWPLLLKFAVLNGQNEILLMYGNDSEHDGYYIPGTVIRYNENVQAAIQRLLKTKVSNDEITQPHSFGWIETPKGDKDGENPTRKEISLLHVCKIIGSYNGRGRFYPLNQIPEETLSHHKALIKELIRRLNLEDRSAEPNFLVRNGF